MCTMSDAWCKLNSISQPATELGEKQVGVNIDYFISNCVFLRGALEYITRRILVAAGKLINLLYCCFRTGCEWIGNLRHLG
jgi:hypothetical protein